MELPTLLDRCRGGDELAWEALVRRFQARLYGIAWHYVGNAEDARDLAQEAFVKIYQNLASCPDASLFLPWIIRIVRNTCIDHLRRKETRPPVSGGMSRIVAAVDRSERTVLESCGQLKKTFDGASASILKRSMSAVDWWGRELTRKAYLGSRHD